MVVHGETGFIVDVTLSPEPPHDPVDPEGFSKALAQGINRLARDPVLSRRMGEAGRQRVVDFFSWQSIARQTLDLYKSLVN